LSSHFGGSSSDGIDSSSSSDGDPWRNSPKTKAFCSELDQTTPLDSQLFLFEFLRVFCLGRELILNRPDAYIRSARLKEALGDRFILTGKAHPIKFWQIKDQVCNLSQLVRKQQSFASSSQVQLTATVLRSSCSLCNLTRGFRENKHRINEPFVLIDTAAFNYGRLSSGMDWWCHDDVGPFTERKATVKACRIASLFKQECPDVSLADFLAFMEFRLLRAFVTAQDGFQIRPDPQTGAMWKPHPKVITLPLGPSLKRNAFAATLKSALSEASISKFTETLQAMRTTHIEAMFSTFAWRPKMLDQLNELGLDVEYKAAVGAEYAKLLHDTQFMASPPGRGSDCFRHWEALLSGAIPIILPSTVAHAAMRYLPAVVVDDYSLASPTVLKSAYSELVERARRSSQQPAEESIMKPLLASYWEELIISIARGEIANFYSGEAKHVSIYRNSTYFGNSDLTATVGADLAECPCQCGLCGEVRVDPSLTVQAPTRPFNVEGPEERRIRLGLRSVAFAGPSSCKTFYPDLLNEIGASNFCDRG
jgi:hypothetical protein